MQPIKPYVFSTLLLINCPALLTAQRAPLAPKALSPLENGFRLPPDSVKPGVYWYWLNDHVSPEGVVKDLEAMHKIGIGRAFIGNIGNPKDEMPYGDAPLFSDTWRAATEAAVRTAAQKGMEIGVFNSPGWSQSGGRGSSRHKA